MADQDCMQAAGDISGGKATCEEGKSAAQQSAACMRNAQEAKQAARRQEAQAAEIYIHVKILQRSVKVLALRFFFVLLESPGVTSQTFRALCCRIGRISKLLQHRVLR